MNKEVTMYQYSKCGTCRNAAKSLTAKGITINKVEIFEHPPRLKQLKGLIQQSGLEIKKFFNTSGEAYQEMNLKDKLKTMTDEEKMSLLSSNGRLLKRPIVTDGKTVTVGFKEEEFSQVWGEA